MSPLPKLPFNTLANVGERLHRDSVESLVHYVAEIARIAQRIEANTQEFGSLSVPDDVSAEIDGRMRAIIDDCDRSWYPPSLIKVVTAVGDAAHLLRDAVLCGEVEFDGSLHPINATLRDLSVEEGAGGEGTHVSVIVIDADAYQLAVDYLFRAVKLLIGPAREAGIDTTILATYDIEE